MASRINPGGLVIAGIGFVLTRFTVTLAIYDEPARFYLAGILPLALGLGLAAFGIALTVARVDAALVRTTALWCVIGAGTMLVLAALTLFGARGGGGPEFSTVRSRTYLSNFLIGGSVGGTLTGLYAARNRRQRGELRQQTRRLQVLNRILRHEVLNAVTVIRGYASTDVDTDAQAAIESYSDTIESTIEEVKHLTRSERPAAAAGESVAIKPVLEESLAAVRAQHPDAVIESPGDGAGTEDGVGLEATDGGEAVAVTADERLSQVFTHLLENAIRHGSDGDQAVELGVDTTPVEVRITVSDTGPGLPPEQRQLLEAGEIQEFDDPGAGFGLNVVRLLVERYGGDVETVVDDGTAVTVVLPRAQPATGAGQPVATDRTGLRPAIPELTVTLFAALIAGVIYGVVAEAFGGSVAFIGVYYGIESTVVGWITHEFHSIVFAFVFAGLVSLTPPAYQQRLSTHVAIGMGWGVVLWLLAAGVISPIWLRLVGIPAAVPSISAMLLYSHLAWGATLGVLSALGYRHLTPRLSTLGDRLRRRFPSVE